MENKPQEYECLHGEWVHVNTRPYNDMKDYINDIDTFIMWVPSGWMMLVISKLTEEEEAEDNKILPNPTLTFIPDADHQMMWDVYNNYPQKVIVKKGEEYND